MRRVAIIQARMRSTRLPGKVMMVLGRRTVLGHVIARVKACAELDAVVVATTQEAHDDVIVAEAARNGAEVHRGSEHDVLSRYFNAARAARAEVVVRVTSDCPLLDPTVLGEALAAFTRARQSDRPCDYLSNTLTRTYPRGLDVEVFTFAALETAHRQAERPEEREHVTPYIYRHPEQFRAFEQRSQEDLSRYRWTLDTEEDWRLIQIIHAALDGDDHMITTREVLDLLRSRPELERINADVEQKKLGE